MRAKPIPMEEQYKLVLECRQSGLSDYHWCLKHDIKPVTFYNWVKRLRKAGTYTIPAPAGRDTYTAMPRQDIGKVELVEEFVKILRQGYPAGSASVFVANDIDPFLGSSSTGSCPGWRLNSLRRSNHCPLGVKAMSFLLKVNLKAIDISIFT